MSDNNVIPFMDRSARTVEVIDLHVPTVDVLELLDQLDGFLEDARDLTSEGGITAADQRSEDCREMASSKIREAIIYIESFRSELVVKK